MAERITLDCPNHPLHAETVEVVRRDRFKRFVVVRVLTAVDDYETGCEIRFLPDVTRDGKAAAKKGARS